MADEIGFIQRMELGRPNGVAPLDSSGLLKKDVLPMPSPKEIGAEPEGAAKFAVASHKAELDPHPIYERVGAASSAIALSLPQAIENHKSEANPHSQYALSTDPRFTDSRTPRAHTHPSNEIVFSSPVWTNLNLLNSWTNKTGISTCRKYASGIVEVRFWLTKATAPTLGEILFNLPLLHRPKEDYQFSAVMTDSKKAYILGHLNVGADGNVGFFSNKMDVNTEVRGRLIFGSDL